MRPGVGIFAVVLAASSAAGAADSWADKLVAGARLSLERAPRYTQRYVRLDYPDGDPGWEIGACTDVVVRALRHADLDLQQAVHADVKRAPAAYPSEPAPDRNIDHRRARNLSVYFERHAASLPPEDFRPGDIVVWDLRGGTSVNHIGMISDRLAASGRPLVIHHYPIALEPGNRDRVPNEEDVLERWRILGHYRLDEAAARRLAPEARGDPVGP